MSNIFTFAPNVINPPLQLAATVVEKLLHNDHALTRIFQPLVNKFCGDPGGGVAVERWLPLVKAELGLTRRSRSSEIQLIGGVTNEEHLMEADQENRRIHVNEKICFYAVDADKGKQLYFLVVKLLHGLSHLLTSTLNAIERQQTAGRVNQPKNWSTPESIGTIYVREWTEVKDEITNKKRMIYNNWVKNGDCGSGWEDLIIAGRMAINKPDSGGTKYSKSLLVITVTGYSDTPPKQFYNDVKDTIIDQLYSLCNDPDKLNGMDAPNTLVDILLDTRNNLIRRKGAPPSTLKLTPVTKASSSSLHSTHPPIDAMNLFETTAEKFRERERTGVKP